MAIQLSKLEANRTDKQQEVKQQPMKIMQNQPTNVEIANLNKGNMIVTKSGGSGYVYIKGEGFTIKVKGDLV